MAMKDAIKTDGKFCARKGTWECPFLYREDDEWSRQYRCRLFGELEHTQPHTQDHVRRAQPCFIVCEEGVA